MKLGYWQEAVKAQQRTFVTVRLVEYGDLFWKDFNQICPSRICSCKGTDGAVGCSLPPLMKQNIFAKQYNYSYIHAKIQMLTTFFCHGHGIVPPITWVIVARYWDPV